MEDKFCSGSVLMDSEGRPTHHHLPRKHAGLRQPAQQLRSKRALAARFSRALRELADTDSKPPLVFRGKAEAPLFPSATASWEQKRLQKLQKLQKLNRRKTEKLSSCSCKSWCHVLQVFPLMRELFKSHRLRRPCFDHISFP